MIDSIDIFAEMERYAQGDGDKSIDAQAVYREMLAEHPVYAGDVEIDRLGQSATAISAHDGPHYTVLGYAESAEVLHRGDVFSNRILELLQGDNIGRTLLTMDDPEHRTHRMLVQRAFSRKAMDRWQADFVEPLVNRMLDDAQPTGSMEFVADFARLMPVAVIQEILGLPAERLPELHRLSTGLMLGVIHPEVATACASRIADLLADHLEARRAEPRDDVVSILVNERLPSGETLTDEEIVSFLRLLLPAGAETTTRLLSSMMVRVLTEPGVLERLREDEALISMAVTETQRLHPPFQNAYRLCLEDSIIGGVEIPKGAAVCISNSSANRDPRRFKDPDSFDLDRGGNNLSFGLGMHICLGVHLAKMEAEVAFRAIIKRFPHLRLNPAMPSPRTTGTIMASPAAVHISWDEPQA